MTQSSKVLLPESHSAVEERKSFRLERETDAEEREKRELEIRVYALGEDTERLPEELPSLPLIHFPNLEEILMTLVENLMTTTA